VQLLAELDRLNISHCYRTVEVSVLGHFQPSIISIKVVVDFTQQALPFSKGNARELLNGMASSSISASQRIFDGRSSDRLLLIYRCNFSFSLPCPRLS